MILEKKELQVIKLEQLHYSINSEEKSTEISQKSLG
jgi:hypothetical protein